jgi:hypothetical protein
LKVGSLIADFSGPGVIGDVVFGQTSLSYAAAMPLQYRLFYEAVFSQVANAPPFYSGIALFFPTLLVTPEGYWLVNHSTDITIEVYSAEGNLVDITDPPLNLGVRERISKLLPEILSKTANQVRGYVVVRASNGFVGQQFFGHSGGDSLSSVPPSVIR